MSETRWLPGPYTVNHASGHPTDAGILGPGREWLGVCPKKQAALFAAAPDLYAALEKEVLRRESSALGRKSKWLAQARAALAKARGES